MRAADTRRAAFSEMAAQILEQIVGDRDRLRRERVGPYRVELALDRGRGRLDHAIGGRGDLWLHERLAIDLARCGQARQQREQFVRSGTHVIGQPFGNATLQPRDVDLFRGPCHEERPEEFGPVVVGEQLHDRLRDARPFADHRLDLGEFDTEAADLHLRVDPPDEIDVARRVQPNEIARPVDALGVTRWPGKGRHREFFGGQVGPIDVADADARATEDQFAFLPRGHRHQPFVDDPRGIAGQGLADRDPLPRFHLGPGRGDRRFGRAIGVEQFQSRSRQPAGQVGGTGLAHPC